jgi:hypothetical protein
MSTNTPSLPDYVIASDGDEVVTVQAAVLSDTVLVRSWQDGETTARDGGVLADVRLTPHQARTMAAALMAAAAAVEAF